jgi:hypothetical protein
MTFITAKWRIDEYHRMIAAGILSDRPGELLKGEIVEISNTNFVETLSISSLHLVT